jgi:hypothetical protein
MRTEWLWVREARSDKDDQGARGESNHANQFEEADPAGGDLHANQFEDPRALSGWPV